MGCCVSSPHAKRRYRDPADLDEVVVPLRYFGTYRNGSVMIPDDIAGMPSTHIAEHLATDPNVVLYEAEIDQGLAFRSLRPSYALLCTPCGVVYFFTKGAAGQLCSSCTCDAACCWLRKEYSTRTFFRIYPNRIMVNNPRIRIPWGLLGCGSWNADHIMTHPFDRGAFGFRKVHCGVINYLCCTWPLYGGVVARQRCQCNGPVWNRMLTDCGGWWCDEWPCDMMCCTYRYYGLARPDEVAAAASICLQAYFEGRTVTPNDVQRCLEYWHQHVSESGGGPKRDVCCEPTIRVPCPSDCSFCYTHMCHPRRVIPYDHDDEISDELKEIYGKSNSLLKRQVDFYNKYQGPVRSSTVCRKAGCRRFCGRKGCCFCTEGCHHCHRKAGEPAPPFDHRDVDDENDASVILRKVLGPPPANVVYKRWEYQTESDESPTLVTYNADGGRDVELGHKTN